MGQKKWAHRVVKHREGSKIGRIESWLVQNRQMGGPTALSICLSAVFGEPVSKQEVWCALTNLRWTKKLKSPVVGFSILSERQIYLRVLKSLWCCDGAIVFVDEKKFKKKEIESMLNYGYGPVNERLPTQLRIFFFLVVVYSEISSSEGNPASFLVFLTFGN